MKKILNLIILPIAFYVISCSETIIDPGGSPTGDLQLFILNEGQFNKNNASLDVWSFDDSTIASDVFPGLGDIGSDIELIDGKLYVVLSNSASLVIMNADLSGKKIINFDPGSGPARIVKIGDSKALLTFQYRSFCAVIDTKGDSVFQHIELGTGSRGIAVLDGKAYTANDMNGITIINTATYAVEHLTNIVTEPYDVTADSINGNIIVLGVGDWMTSSPAEMIWLRALDNTVLTKKVFSPDDYFNGLYPSFIGNGNLYVLFDDRVSSYDLATRSIKQDTLIRKGFYGGIYDQYHNRLILGDDNDFVSRSIVSFYSTAGDSLYSINTGILPAHFTIYKKP